VPPRGVPLPILPARLGQPFALLAHRPPLSALPLGLCAFMGCVLSPRLRCSKRLHDVLAFAGSRADTGERGSSHVMAGSGPVGVSYGLRVMPVV
jgi:hypothetical protein